MKEISGSKAMDMMLEFCIKHNDKLIPISTLRNELFPELNNDQIFLLLKRINDVVDDVANVILNEGLISIGMNGLTQTFLDQGGFVQLDVDEKKEVAKQRERDDIEFELAKSNIEANKFNRQIAKRNKRVTIINIVIGIINIIAVLTTIWLTFVKE